MSNGYLKSQAKVLKRLFPGDTLTVGCGKFHRFGPCDEPELLEKAAIMAGRKVSIVHGDDTLVEVLE